MKKIIQWYNLLTDKGMLDLDEEAKEEEKKRSITSLLKHKEVGVPRKGFRTIPQLLFISDTDVSIR